MIPLIASDCPDKAARLRHVLAQIGHSCPASSVVPCSQAAAAAWAMEPKPDFILFLMPAEQERGLEVLKKLRDSFDARIVAVGPRELGVVMGAVHAGVHDYLDETGDLQSQLVGSLSRAHLPEPRGRQLGELITILGASGGCGQTFLAVNLAAALAAVHGRSAIVDLDLKSGDVSALLGVKPRHSIADLCRNIDKLDKRMFDQALTVHSSNISVLAAPEDPDEAAQITVEGVQSVLRCARTDFPAVVVDMKTFFAARDYADTIRSSSAILLMLRLDFASLRNCQRVLAQLDALEIDRKKLHIVVNRFGQPQEIEVSKAESTLGVRLSTCLPEDARTVNICINCGTPVIVEAPRSAIAKSIVALANTLSGQGTSPPADSARIVIPSIAPLATKVRQLWESGMRTLTPQIESGSQVP